MKQNGFLAKLCLFVATIIWGTTFFIMEGTIENIGVFTLLAIRFTTAAVILGAVLWKRLKNIDKTYILQGFLLGFFIIIAYAFQTYGLADEATTPGKNAFLTAIYCVLVPFMSWAVTKDKPDGYNIIAAIMGILGITLISVSGNDFSSICAGDFLTLMGGIFFGIHMVAVPVFSNNRDVLLLTVLQLFFSGILAWIPALIMEPFPANLPVESAVSILYLAVFATCACYLMQNIGQKYTQPAAASLILSLEAVFGVIFSVIFTKEQISARVMAGFIIVFLAILISEIKPFSKFFKKGANG